MLQKNISMITNKADNISVIAQEKKQEDYIRNLFSSEKTTTESIKNDTLTQLPYMEKTENAIYTTKTIKAVSSDEIQPNLLNFLMKMNSPHKLLNQICDRLLSCLS